MKTPEYKPINNRIMTIGAYYWVRKQPCDLWKLARYEGNGNFYIISNGNLMPVAEIGEKIHNPNESAGLVGHAETSYAKDSDSEAPSGQHIRQVCNELADFLIAKNKSYGNSALEPVRCFSKADTVEQINVRLDDKISRIMRGDANGEDVEEDLLGYLILKRVFYKQEVLRKEMELEERRQELSRESRQDSKLGGPFGNPKQ